MTIKRQYSLPNCTLVLEGLTSDDGSAGQATARPLMSVLVNSECRFVGHEKALSGGRDFLESLVVAVSRYAQEFLSGVRHPEPRGSQALVQLREAENRLHRLTFRPQTNGQNHHVQGEPIQIDLTTVQLFDLVEAVDQFFADTQTLPDLALRLAPVSKKHIAAQEPIAKRVLPAAVGVSSLAIAAIALFFIPIPERRPEPVPQRESEQSTGSSSTTAPSSPPGVEGPGNNQVNAVQSTTDQADVDQADTEPSGAEPSEVATDREDLEVLLGSAPPITDGEEIRQLNRQLRDRINEAWDATPTFDEDLVYRVGVAADGEIVGYKYDNDAALEYVQETPLPDLRYLPNEQIPNTEPIGQFRVVFTPGGVVEVSPWDGYP